MTDKSGVVSSAAIAAAYRDAHYWFTAAGRDHAYIDELAARGLAASQARAAGIGWAAAEPAALTDHLIRRGHRLAVLREAGLAVRRGPRHGDVLRERITFAYLDRNRAVYGFTARTLDGAAAKWLNTRNNAVFDKSRLLYGMHALDEATQAVAVVEGAWDAATVTATTGGRVVGVAACGTAFTPTHAQTVARLGLPIIVATDADTGGRTAAVRIHQALLAVGVTRAGYLALPDGHDPCSWHTTGHDLPAALADVQPGSLTRFVLDSHRRELDPGNGIPAQLAHLRTQLAPLLADLPAEQRAAATSHLAAITGLLPLTIHDALAEHPTAAGKPPGRIGPPPAPVFHNHPAAARTGSIDTKEKP